MRGRCPERAARAARMQQDRNQAGARNGTTTGDNGLNPGALPPDAVVPGTHPRFPRNFRGRSVRGRVDARVRADVGQVVSEIVKHYLGGVAAGSAGDRSARVGGRAGLV